MIQKSVGALENRMTKPRVNYDQIASTYDKRFVHDRTGGVGEAILDLVQRLNAVRILEVRCGTCHWLTQMHRVSSELYGAARVLRRGGAFAVAGSDPHGRKESWYAYHYFDGVYETDLMRFPAWRTVREWMVESGFEGIEWREDGYSDSHACWT